MFLPGKHGAATLGRSGFRCSPRRQWAVFPGLSSARFHVGSHRVSNFLQPVLNFALSHAGKRKLIEQRASVEQCQTHRPIHHAMAQHQVDRQALSANDGRLQLSCTCAPYEKSVRQPQYSISMSRRAVCPATKPLECLQWLLTHLAALKWSFAIARLLLSTCMGKKVDRQAAAERSRKSYSAPGGGGCRLRQLWSIHSVVRWWAKVCSRTYEPNNERIAHGKPLADATNQHASSVSASLAPTPKLHNRATLPKLSDSPGEAGVLADELQKVA